MIRVWFLAVAPILLAGFTACASQAELDRELMDALDYLGLGDVLEAREDEKVEALLRRGASANARDASGRAALFKAVSKSRKKSAELLLSKGADVNARNYEEGITALMSAADSSTDKADLPTVTALLAAGADVNAKDARGRTALMRAARSGAVGIVRALLAAASDVNARDDRRRSALMEAAIEGESDAMSTLIAGGADTKARCKDGKTAAEHAAHRAELLAQKEASRLAAERALVRERETFSHFTSVDVFVIDTERGTGHGTMVKVLIEKYFRGSVSIVETGRVGEEGLSGVGIGDALRSVLAYAERHPRTRLVVNMSWGTDARNSSLALLFGEMSRRGLVLVAAAGNEGRAECAYPAGYEGVIAVASVERIEDPYTRLLSYSRAPYSNYGTCVRLGVPDFGLELVRALESEAASVWRRSRGLSRELRSALPDLLRVMGTSFAAARASGIIAQVLGSRPYLANSEIIKELPTDYSRVEGFSSEAKVLNPAWGRSE